MITISIIGPESTGKTALAKALASEYNTQWVPEYAREYLEKLDRPYQQKDLIDITRGQLNLKDKLTQKANQLLFLDTDLHVIKVWSEFKYGNCNPYILQELSMQTVDLYILTFFDIPYEEDPLRESPNDRPELFDIYENELKQADLPYIVVQGSHEKRMKTAKKAINAIR